MFGGFFKKAFHFWPTFPSDVAVLESLQKIFSDREDVLPIEDITLAQDKVCSGPSYWRGYPREVFGPCLR